MSFPFNWTLQALVYHCCSLVVNSQLFGYSHFVLRWFREISIQCFRYLFLCRIISPNKRNVCITNNILLYFYLLFFLSQFSLFFPPFFYFPVSFFLSISYFEMPFFSPYFTHSLHISLSLCLSISLFLFFFLFVPFSHFVSFTLSFFFSLRVFLVDLSQSAFHQVYFLLYPGLRSKVNISLKPLRIRTFRIIFPVQIRHGLTKHEPRFARLMDSDDVKSNFWCHK